MSIKIYANQTTIYLTEEVTEELQKIKSNKSTMMLLVKNKKDFDEILQAIQSNIYQHIILVNESIEFLKINFFKLFTIIEAAGGIVQNVEKELLFILRRGKWDLPKGKLEKNEDLEKCAQREIEEETGLTNLHFKHKIGETYHIYAEEGLEILKISHWYYFTVVKKTTLIPQIEEDIEEVKWIATQHIKIPMANTYQNIKDILTIFFDTP